MPTLNFRRRAAKKWVAALSWPAPNTNGPNCAAKANKTRDMHALCALAALSGAFAAPLLGNLQVEGLFAPLATITAPRFSWQTGAAQLSYQLLVSSTFPSPALLWDSGVVPSNASWLIPYSGGAPLPSDADFTWEVRATLQGIGLVAASATFSTAPPAPLPGAWLGFADTLRGAAALPPTPILRARLHVTGVGCYQAYVNGALVSPPLAPGFGHAPSARALFDTYDVARLLRAGGENVVGLRLGSCKWGAWGQYCSGTPAQCNAGWAALVVDQGGCPRATLATGPAWAAANTSVLFQHLWHGELTDARLEQEGWAAPGFANASAWAPAAVVDTADSVGPLGPSRAPPVDAGAPLTPATVTALPSGPHVFDLGANVAGSCGVELAPPAGEAPAPSGAVVTLLHGEVLHANGSVWNHYLPPGGTHQPNGLNQPQMNYTYIARGGGREFAHGPRFAFFGFRYIELRGWPYAAAPTPAALRCSFIHTALPPTAAVAFPSAPLLNTLQEAVLRTHLSNYVTVPTDCPQREKRGWVRRPLFLGALVAAPHLASRLSLPPHPPPPLTPPSLF